MNIVKEIDRFQIILDYLMKSIGLVGNLLMFLVYNQSSLRRLSVSIYFRHMSIVIIIYIAYNFFLLFNWSKVGYKSNVVFKLLYFITHLYIPILAWFEVAASFDRFLTILFALKFRFHKRRKVQRLLIACLVLFNMACYSFILFQFKILGPGSTYEDILANRSFVRVLFIMNLLVDSAIPFGLMFILSVSTFLGVLLAHRRIKSLRQPQNCSHTRTLIRDIKFGVTIIIQNCFFFFRIVLYRLNTCFNLNPFDFHNQYLAYHIFVFLLTDLFQYYYLVIFYVQLAVNSQVRKVLRKLLRMVYSFFARIFF